MHLQINQLNLVENNNNKLIIPSLSASSIIS